MSQIKNDLKREFVDHPELVDLFKSGKSTIDGSEKVYHALGGRQWLLEHRHHHATMSFIIETMENIVREIENPVVDPNVSIAIAQELWQALRELVDAVAPQMDSEDNPTWRYCKLKLLQYSQFAPSDEEEGD